MLGMYDHELSTWSYASTVFKGKIVVSGGLDVTWKDLNTVEAYDHVDNSWSYMPNIIHRRSLHRLVAIRNKLYVFGRSLETCEVFDSSINTFSLLKSPSPLLNMDTRLNINLTRPAVISIGNKILIFRNNTLKLTYFDLDKADWYEEPFELTKDIKYYLCLKLPKI